MATRLLSSLSALLVAGFFAVHGSAPVSAFETKIDQFVVLKNGNLILNDGFDDGFGPPSGENFQGLATNPTTYNMRGVVDTESSSKAILDTDNGFPTLGLAGRLLGEPIVFTQATLRTNTQPLSVSTNGLKIDDTIEVRGLFDLIEPVKKGDIYGISLTDRALNIGNIGTDTVRLTVRKNLISGNNVIQFHRSDFVTGFAERADRVALDPNHAQILLVLTRGGTSAADREVNAKFAYVDSAIDISGDLSSLTFTQLDNVIDRSTPSGSPNIGQPITIFNGEDFTRALFRVLVPRDITVARLETSSPASISRLVDTPNADFSLTFDYRFETTTGELTVSLNGTPLTVIPAPGALDDNFTAASIDITDPALQGLTGVELEFTIDDPNPGAVVLIDNINFPGLPNENFADGTLSNWTTQGNVSVLVIESPEDAEVEFDRAKLAQHRGKSTFHIKGTLIFDPVNSDGFNLPEDVRVSVGGFTQDIPADEFRVIRERLFSFSSFFGNGNGGEVRAVVFLGWGPGINYLELKPDGRFNIWATKVDLGNTDVDEPVPFSLRVGNDLGQTQVEFERFFNLNFSPN